MYTEENLDSLDGQLRGRVLAWLVPELALLAAVILSLSRRNEYITGALTSALGAVLLFSLSTRILPLRRYHDFVRQALHGKTTRDEVSFESIGADTQEHEGIRVYPVAMRTDAVKPEMAGRTFFWDANLPLPDWQSGEWLALRSWERVITWWERADRPSA